MNTQNKKIIILTILIILASIILFLQLEQINNRNNKNDIACKELGFEKYDTYKGTDTCLDYNGDRYNVEIKYFKTNKAKAILLDNYKRSD